jgi:hypothetical protein
MIWLWGLVRGQMVWLAGMLPRVTVVSAPAGNGKTVLLRSWIGEAGLAGRAAWVLAGQPYPQVSVSTATAL